MREQADWIAAEVNLLAEPFAVDQIAPVGSTSIAGIDQLRWSNPLCELARPGFG